MQTLNNVHEKLTRMQDISIHVSNSFELIHHAIKFTILWVSPPNNPRLWLLSFHFWFSRSLVWYFETWNWEGCGKLFAVASEARSPYSALWIQEHILSITKFHRLLLSSFKSTDQPNFIKFATQKTIFNFV